MSSQALTKYSQCGYCGRTPDNPEASLRLCSCEKRSHSETTKFPALCIDHCAQCDIDNCQNKEHVTCWQAMLSPFGRARHQPEAFIEDLQVESILYSETDKHKQYELHKRDRKARWFKADLNSDDKVAVLEVTDRFLELARESVRLSKNLPSHRKFPCLVSFFGDTGVGKSTLIKALITTSKSGGSGSKWANSTFAAPVSAIRNDAHSGKPTSSGVHLYLDPQSASTDRPWLFADCEGFRGSNAIPNSEQIIPTGNLQNDSSISEGDESQMQILLRRLAITSPQYRNGSRTEIVEDLYPRFVYVFSDVMVFVINNTKQIMSDIKRLLEWCSSGLDASINHSGDKALILMLNKPDEHHESYLDPAAAERNLLGDLHENVWEDSPKLRQVVDNINQLQSSRNKIHSTMDLLRKFFNRINVCYVPLKGLEGIRTETLYRQYKTLRNLISDAADHRRWQGMRTCTLYNVNDMGRLFDLALEHFATSNKPFDFYSATRKNSPDPKTMENHITKLLIHVEKFNDEVVWQTFPSLIASCLVNVALRGGQIRSEPEPTFNRFFKASLLEGIRTYYRFHASCSFICEDGNKCGCRYECHPSHRSPNAKRPQFGSFEPSDIENCIKDKCRAVKIAFVELYTSLDPSRPGYNGNPDPEIAIVQKRANILTFHHFKKFWEATQSFKTCFACLRSVPHAVLPCGHALCGNCFSDFGQDSKEFDCAYELQSCIFCRKAFEIIQVYQVKPRYAGTRVLTLEGGGVRGIIQLKILQKLEKMIDLDVPIGRFFDLIVGASTGGIISLGLAMTDLNMYSLIQKFRDINKKVYEHNRAGGNGVIQSLTGSRLSKGFFIASGIWESIYRTLPLESELKLLLKGKREMSLFGSPIATGKQFYTKVAVTALKHQGRTPCVFTNYNHTITTDNGYSKLEREENQGDEVKAWEAGVATAASPIYFTPFNKLETKEVYMDGAIDKNSPIKQALEETKLIWPHAREDYILSIGAGNFKGYSVDLSSMFSQSTTQLLFQHFLDNINGEKAWDTFKRESGAFDEKVHYRINPSFSERSCRLDDWKEMEKLEAKVDDYFNPKRSDGGADACKQLEHLARLLIAKLFYFQPESSSSDERGGKHLYKVKGKILCRLERGDPALKLLLERIDFFSTYDLRHRPLDFTHASDTTFKHIEFDRKAIATAISNGENWLMPDITFGSEDENAEMVISIQLHRTVFDQATESIVELPISGFPCSLRELCRFNIPPGDAQPNSPVPTDIPLLLGDPAGSTFKQKQQANRPSAPSQPICRAPAETDINAGLSGSIYDPAAGSAYETNNSSNSWRNKYFDYSYLETPVGATVPRTERSLRHQNINISNIQSTKRVLRKPNHSSRRGPSSSSLDANLRPLVINAEPSFELEGSAPGPPRSELGSFRYY